MSLNLLLAVKAKKETCKIARNCTVYVFMVTRGPVIFVAYVIIGHLQL